MAGRRLFVCSNALGSIAHFYPAVVLAHPHLLAGILPWHRIAASLPGDVSITRHLTLLIIAVRIGRSAVDRLQGAPFLTPASQHWLMSRAMYSLISDLRYPAAQLGIKIHQAARLPTQQTA